MAKAVICSLQDTAELAHFYLTHDSEHEVVAFSGHCVIEPYSFFGVNSTIRDQIHLAEGTLIGMDSSVTTDTEPWSVYTGVPARKRSVPSTEAGL